MKRILNTFLLLFLLLTPLTAQSDLAYQMPPRELVAVVDAPSTPSVSFDPLGRYMVLTQRPGNPSIEDFSDEMLRLAGLRIDPAINAGSRPGYSVSMELKDMKTLESIQLNGLPDPIKIMGISWSPAGNGFSLIQLKSDGLYLWYVSVSDFTARQLSNRPLNGLLGSTTEWMPDGSGMLVKFIPEGRGQRPRHSNVPSGPVIQENQGTEAAVRTYQDLLSTPADVEVFDYFAHAEICKVMIDGTIVQLTQPAVFTGIDY